MKSLVMFTIMLFTSINLFAVTAQEAIESANKSGLAVFLVITDPGNANTQQAMEWSQGDFHPTRPLLKY